MKNILTTKFETVNDTAPFDKIKTSDFLPAFKVAIATAKEQINSIAESNEKPSFENTIAALSYSGKTLDRVSSIFFNLHSAETNDEIQKIAEEVSPLLSEFGNDITLNPHLFARVKSVHDLDDKNLNGEEKMLLVKQYKSFVRNGALLNDGQKIKLRALDKELSLLSLQFGENVLAETNAYQLHITDKNKVAGIPEGAQEAAQELAKETGKEGWIFTLDMPSYLAVQTYADNRDVRKTLALASGSRAFKSNEHDNQKIVLDIVQKRHQRANLLGYKSHAHFILEERMAETGEKVTSFLNELLEKARPAAKREFDKLSEFAKDVDGIDQLQKWDGAYYSEKLKQELFDLDDEKLKPYFQLEKVLQGAFDISGKLYGLNFKPTDTIAKYHKDVAVFEVYDEDKSLVAIFYADFYPRTGKRNGAWMTSYKPQFIWSGINERPHVSIVCNFTKPTSTKPALLTFNEVTTLFHEFGHALHGMLANTTFPTLSGTSVFWDFVELPSQIFENWCYEPEALALFAKHYQTGEALPKEYIERIKQSANFHEGMATLRQLSFGLLDMAWHANDPMSIADVKEFETNAFSGTQLYPDVADNAMSTAFSHIFQGGYAAGYYSYKWAEVLDADAFAHFKEQGIFNREIAMKFRKEILSKGGTAHPMELYKNFRGQEPNSDALLKRAGLI